MSGSRRDVLAGASGAMFLAAAGSSVAAKKSAKTMIVKRIHAKPDGGSAIEVLDLAPPANPLPAVAVLMAKLRKSTAEDWHVTPEKVIIITLAGAHSIMTSNGAVASFGPGEVAYIEDMTGKGHQNRVTANGAVLILRMPADFDIKTWASQKQ